MITNAQQNTLLSEIQTALSGHAGRDDALQSAMQIIARELPAYDWVGIYFYDNGVLNLGPYVGAKTNHILIEAGRGVCGTAVAENRNILVGDVRQVENYLACSAETRSEIVVLIRDDDAKILGQIDADGHEPNAFDTSDEQFLEAVARQLAPLLVQKGKNQ